MDITVNGIRCNTREGLQVASQYFEGEVNGKPGAFCDVLMRTPSGEFYLYRDWDGLPVDSPREDFITLLDEAAAQKWAKDAYAHDSDPDFDPPSDERVSIRFKPSLWDEPTEQRTRITVTLTNEVIAKLKKFSESEGYTISQLLDHTCRDMFRMELML